VIIVHPVVGSDDPHLSFSCFLREESNNNGGYTINKAASGRKCATKQHKGAIGYSKSDIGTWIERIINTREEE
jgi:hypothetical protein